MHSFVARTRARLAPAALTAAGVTLVAAGLLSYADPAAVSTASPSPTAIGALPSATPTVTAMPSASGPAGSPLPSASGVAPSPSLSTRTATRVAIPALGIDLPVVRPPRDPRAYPWCNVAMFIKELGQPGQDRATYLYAHAREGMFLPILEASRRNNGRRMLGRLVEVWTSDDRLFLYEIVEVRRHQLELTDALTATTEQLWLQTSEGPRGTPGKTQVIARPLSSAAADHAAAHPRARPVDCE
jgi:hypothetical protein